MGKKQVNASWYSISNSRDGVVCCSCKNFFEGPKIDHHPSWCPFCRTENIVFIWKDKKIQIIPKLAPQALKITIEWLQNNLDELEFLELIVALEELSENM